MKRVNTVRGEISPETLGHCQPHEHVYIEGTPALADHPELRVNVLDLAIWEHELYRRAGGGSVVDVQTLGAGRDALALEQVSRQTGVHIVASTGFHVPWLYAPGHWLLRMNRDALTRLFAGEIEEGMFLGGGYSQPTLRTGLKAGAIKTAYSHGYDEEALDRLFGAAGAAAVQTGVSVIVHTEGGEGAEESVRRLFAAGLDPRKILVCHTDWRTENFALREKLARMGVLLSFDAINIFEFHPVEEEVRMVLHMLERGHEDSVTLATDPNRPRLKSYGAPVGVDYILTEFLPLLAEAGVTREHCEKMARINPARLLSREG